MPSMTSRPAGFDHGDDEELVVGVETSGSVRWVATRT
jgi:hypothetical protein